MILSYPNKNLMLYASLIAERLGIRRCFMVVFAVSLVLNLMLAIALIRHQPDVRTVIIPPTLAQEREVWSFNNEGPSASYLERFALSILSYAACVTPDTIDSARRAVLEHVDPAAYGALEETLIVEGDRMKKDHSSTVFYADEAHVNLSTLTVDVEGVQKLLVGSTVTRTQRKTWRLTFRYDAGRLFLTSLTDRLPKAIQH